MNSIKDTISVPKIIFPSVSNKDQLRKILNVNQWNKFNEFLSIKLELAAEIFFNRYIYYHLKDAISYKKKIFNIACKYGNMEIVQLMIEKIESEISTLPRNSRDKKRATYWNSGLCYACKGGHLSIIQLMIDKGANDWNWGLYYACKGGHLFVVQLMIEKIESSIYTLPPTKWGNEGANNNLNYGLSYACIKGHLSVVQLLIDKGANNWNDGLIGACYQGNLLIVQLFIDKGANDWNSGLRNACLGGHLAIVELMVEKIESELSTFHPVLRDEKGANNLNDGLAIAKDNKHLEIVNYLSKLLKIEN